MLTKSAAAATLLVFALSTQFPVRAQGNTWDKVRYNGGTIATKTKPDDWDNKLTITSSQITIELEDGQRLVVDPERVTNISYGQEAHRRVGTMIALGILVAADSPPPSPLRRPASALFPTALDTTIDVASNSKVSLKAVLEAVP